MPESERNENDSRVGVLVAPGTYRVSMHQRVNGELTDLGQAQTFDVVSIREPTLPGSPQEERIVFQRQVDEIRRAVGGTIDTIDETVESLAAIRNVLQRSTADMALYARANDIEQRLTRERDRLAGNATRSSFGAPGPMSVNARLRHAAYNPHANAHGPTATQRQSLSIARDVYDSVTAELAQLIDVEYSALESALDGAGVPWTPGRGVQ